MNGKTRGPEVAFWATDGLWHITEAFEPNAGDRAAFPVSYPAGDPGPFFIWSRQGYETEKQARDALAAPEKPPIEFSYGELALIWVAANQKLERANRELEKNPAEGRKAEYRQIIKEQKSIMDKVRPITDQQFPLVDPIDFKYGEQ